MYQPGRPMLNLRQLEQQQRSNLLLRPYGLLLFPLCFISAMGPVLDIAIHGPLVFRVGWAIAEYGYKFGDHDFLLPLAFFIPAFFLFCLCMLAFKRGVAGLPLNILSLCISIALDMIHAGLGFSNFAPILLYVQAGCLFVSAAILLFEKIKARHTSQ